MWNRESACNADGHRDDKVVCSPASFLSWRPLSSDIGEVDLWMVVGEYSEYSPAKACLIIETPSKLKFRVPNAGLEKTKKRLTQGSVAAEVQGAILNGQSIRDSHRYCKIKIDITLTY